MWLSETMSRQQDRQVQAGEGVVTIGGEKPAVVTDGEQRDLRVVSPGGYLWQPAVAERAVVLCTTGHVLGSEQKESGLQPGEVKIFSPGASIYLANDGSIRLEGNVYINGERWVAHGSGSA